MARKPDKLPRGVYVRDKGKGTVGLVVECADKEQMRDLMTELAGRGLKCRPASSGPKEDPVYWIRFTDQNGVKRRELVGRSFTAACELVEQRRTEVRLLKFNPEDLGRKRRQVMTVAEMFAHYLPLRIDVRNKEEDARYAAYWTNLFGDYGLDELKPADLDRWRSERIQQVKPATVNRAMTYLRAYYNLALADEHCKTNPAAKPKALRENNERDRHLLPDEEQALEKQMKPLAFSLVLFAIVTGLRRGEQFGLEWSRVDFRSNNLKIVETKSGKTRFVPINAKARAILEQWLARREEDSPWVFHPIGLPARHYNAHNFTERVFGPALERAGIRGFVWHDLRHTCGSRLAMAGKPLHTIGQILGQDTLSVTKRYAHLTPDHLRDAIDIL